MNDLSFPGKTASWIVLSPTGIGFAMVARGKNDREFT